MVRILILLALVVLIVWWVMSRIRRDPPRDDPPDAAPPKAGRKKALPATEIVACAHCGVNLPQTEAVQDRSGLHYCGDEHRLGGPR